MKTLLHISHVALLRKSIACFLVFCMLFVLPARVVHATPTNPNVVAGSAGVTQAGNTTNVDVLSNSAVINWSSLNTTSAETLQFVHDGGHFAVLNRVTQGGMTQFDGSLFGNQGTIVIVNPNGIAFGPTALVNAYQFTASSLDIDNADFMNGVYDFAGDGVGAVENFGHISAEKVALIGKQVLNAGTITTPNGYTIMAAGNRVYLGSEGSDVVVEVAGVTIPDGAVDGLGDVVNEGTIDAGDGAVIMAAGDTYVRAIDGLDTLTVGVSSGTGRVGQFGTIHADGTDSDGGSITMTAADLVVLGDDSVTTANGGANGDGGQIIAYSPDTALFSENAVVQAQGGAESGDGGFVEVSGREYVEIGGVVDTTAANGDKGTFLIDPSNIEISDVSPNFTNLTWNGFEYAQAGGLGQSHLGTTVLETQLNSSNVIVNTDSGGSPATTGWIEVRDSVSWSADTALTLQSNGYITIQSDAPITNTSGAGEFNAYSQGENHTGNININANVTAGSVTLQAGNPSIDTPEQSDIRIADGVTVAAVTGDADLSAREHIFIDGDVIAEQGDVLVNADSDGQGRGNVALAGMIDAEQGSVEITGRDVTVDTIHAQNNIDITAMEDLGFEGGGNVTTTGLVSTDGGDITIHAVEDITIDGQMQTAGSGSIAMYAAGPVDSDIFVKDIIALDSGTLSLNANDDIRVGDAGTSIGGISITGGGDAELIAGNDIEIMDTGTGIDLDSGQLTMLSGRDRRYDNIIDIEQDITAGTIVMEAGDPTQDVDAKGIVNIDSGVEVRSTENNEAGAAIDISAREHIVNNGTIIAEQGDIVIVADSDLRGRGNVESAGHIDAMQGSVDITGRSVTVNTVHAGENIELTSLQDVGFEGGSLVDAQGLISTDNGDIDIKVMASPETTDKYGEPIYPESENYDPDGLIRVGDNIEAGGNVTLHNKTEFYGTSDQSVIAETGSVTAKDSLSKLSDEGKEVAGGLYLQAQEDVSLNGDVINEVSGVSIIGNKIFTPGSDALNVAVEGYSDYLNDTGVDLPFADGKAAIVLMSVEDLELGPDASLHARGYFISTDEGTPGEPGTDDRPGAELLQEDGAIIGGVERDEGIPGDIAIYARSTEGDVIVHNLPGIIVDNFLAGEENGGTATVVLDAYESVLLPYLQSLSTAELKALADEMKDNPLGFRLEVVSRVTEWLFQAVQNETLPFAANPEVMEALLGADYVLRGAGQGNPDIAAEENSNRAWVLENPVENPAVPLAALAISELKGCPVEMDAAAAELAMNSDELQLLIGSSLATNPNLQPCEACQRLVTAANILNDSERLAAMNEIFNTLAPADAPFTPEVQANITTAFANLSDENSQYALAGEYVEAFVDYVAVVGNELMVPVGDPVVFAMEKHAEPLMNENPNIAAYLIAQAGGQNL